MFVRFNARCALRRNASRRDNTLMYPVHHALIFLFAVAVFINAKFDVESLVSSSSVNDVQLIIKCLFGLSEMSLIDDITESKMSSKLK